MRTPTHQRMCYLNVLCKSYKLLLIHYLKLIEHSQNQYVLVVQDFRVSLAFRCNGTCHN